MKTCSTYRKLEGEEKVNCIKMQSLWKGPSYSMVSCSNSQDKYDTIRVTLAHPFEIPYVGVWTLEQKGQVIRTCCLFNLAHFKAQPVLTSSQFLQQTSHFQNFVLVKRFLITSLFFLLFSLKREKCWERDENLNSGPPTPKSANVIPLCQPA